MNPLNDIIPAWQASDGNWFAFVASLVVSLSHATAASNVTPED